MKDKTSLTKSLEVIAVLEEVISPEFAMKVIDGKFEFQSKDGEKYVSKPGEIRKYYENEEFTVQKKAMQTTYRPLGVLFEA